MTVAELQRRLRKCKCRFVRHGGSHDEWYSPITKKSFRVPRHDTQELKTGTAEAIMKQAGIK